MSDTAELYDGTELEEGDTVVLTLAGRGETQQMTVSNVPDRYTADLQLGGDWVGAIKVNPAKMSADNDHVANLKIGHGDSRETVEDIEVA